MAIILLCNFLAYVNEWCFVSLREMPLGLFDDCPVKFGSGNFALSGNKALREPMLPKIYAAKARPMS